MLTYNAGSGNNTLNISGGTFTFSTDPSVTSGNLTINDNAALAFTATNTGIGINLRHLAVLNIGAGATATFASSSSHSDRMLLVVASLSINSTGTLSLGGNDADVSATSLDSLNSDVASGFNGGAWRGKGINSLLAAADPSRLTAVGIISNNDGTGQALYGSGTALGAFDGINPGLNDVLIKYTYYGDANLDGQVDGSDYTKIDNGFNNHLTGWANGNFNYDNTINGSDYTLIDNAFNTQAGSLALIAPTAIVVAQSSSGRAVRNAFAAAAPIAQPSAVNPPTFNWFSPITLATPTAWSSDLLSDQIKHGTEGLFTRATAAGIDPI